MQLRSAAGLVLVALFLTLVLAAPVLRAPDSLLFGREIVGRHADPFIVINQFENPRPLGLYTQPATDYLGAAIATVTGNGVSAYNAVVLVSFPLAALFAYLLAFQLTGSRWASWLAGLLYAFAPFHIAQSAYHPHGAQTQWFPLYLLALWLCVESGSLRRLLLLAVSLALVVLSNFYYGLMAAVLTPIALFGFWWVQRGQSDGSPRGLSRTLVALAALGGAGLAYVAAFAPTVFENRDQLAFPQTDLALYGAHSASYLVPPVGHPIVGSWVQEFWRQRTFDGMLEQQITIGLGLVLLAVFGLVRYFKGDQNHGLTATPALLLIAATAFVFSLAPADSTGVGNLLRPSGLVYGLLPMFRAYARFGLIVFLAVSILASVAAIQLLEAEKWRRVLGIGLLLLVFIELLPFPPLRFRDVLPTTAHRFLSDGDDPVRVLDCADPARLSEQPVFQRFKHRLSLRSRISDCGDPDFPVKLAHEGFTHLLVRRPSPLGDWLAPRSAPIGTTPVLEFEDALLYKVATPTQPRIFLEFDNGFHWREFRGDESYRWMQSSGELTIVNPSSIPLEISLGMRLHSFPQERTVAVELNDSVLTEFEVRTEPDLYHVPTISITPGRHKLTLRPGSPAVVADSILGNGDLRELSIALWGWTTNGLP